MVNPNRKPFFKELDHTADLGVEIYGQDVEDLFRNAVHALYVLLGFPETTDDTLVRSGQTLKVEGQDQEDALVRLLGDLLYRADVEKERFFPEKVFLIRDSETGSVSVRIKGGWQDVSPEDRSGGREIKAVTYHRTEICRSPQGFVARLVMDI